MNKATLFPLPEKEVEWVRYMEENLEEVTAFCKELLPDKRVFLDTGTSQALYWESKGIVRVGDFIVKGTLHGNPWVHEHIVSWKDFPYMVKEDIPVMFDEFREWQRNQNKE